MIIAAKVTEFGFTGIRMEIETALLFDTVTARLRELTGRGPTASCMEPENSDRSEFQYAKEVERKFVGSSGFMFLSAIDHGACVQKLGIQRRAVRWILGTPLMAIALLRQDMTSGLFTPVELLIIDNPVDNGCVVTYVRPSSLILINDSNPELKAAAMRLDEKLEALVMDATQL
ncbi:uncharacterized protein (DUF302 family) [Paraburkholderia sp. GAS199]|uniref:DUF302 domain-containing protein n=1 Tax=Paraburkholderia sp. GAS199 TaxID=3035126 RepID=UPI003D23736A